MSVIETVAPLVTLDGPLPVAPPYGLLPSVVSVPVEDSRWEAGANVYPYSDALPEPWGPCGSGTFVNKPDAAPVTIPDPFLAFAAVFPLHCTAAGIGSYDDFRERAMRVLAATESYAAERAFMFGIGAPLNPHLADGNHTLPAGAAAVTPAVGLAWLESVIGDTGRQGVIHATPPVITSWDTLVQPSRGTPTKLRTTNGTLVVSGGGYNGGTPGGESDAAAGQSWVYATGPVEARVSEPYFPHQALVEAMARDLNDVTVYAERNMLITWDTALQAAVLIDWTP